MQTIHNKKLMTLSLSQEKPLFNVEKTVIFYEFQGHIPNYVHQTLALGPRHPVMTKFNDKDILVELDSFLNFCDKNGVPDKTKTEINIKTLNYIKVCKKQKVPKHISLTQVFS